MQELIRLKDDLISTTAHPPMYLKCDLENYDLKQLNTKFDVILIEPPLEEYSRTYGVSNTKESDLFILYRSRFCIILNFSRSQ